MPPFLRATFFIVLPLALVGSPATAGDMGRVPSVDDLLSIKTIGRVAISPDGKRVAYTVSQTGFKTDAFIDHIWIVDPVTGRNYQLTRGEKSAGNIAWSPDSRWPRLVQPLYLERPAARFRQSRRAQKIEVG